MTASRPARVRRTRRSRGERPRRRTGAGELVVAGRRVVGEAIRAGACREVLISERAVATPGLREVREEAARAGVALRTVASGLLDGIAPNHQGVAARVFLPPPIGERELRTWPFEPEALVVLLDGVLDPQNVGAAARVAEAAGASLLVNRERRSGPVSAAAVRASAGALFHLPRATVANLPRVLEILKDRGFTVVGLDAGAQRTIDDGSAPDGRVALVVGSEEVGMSRLVREACDELVRLPMAGRVMSLNASSALSAAVYGYVRPRSRGTLS